MAFVLPKETYPGRVYSLTIGLGDRAVTVGGENVLPFCTFDGIVPNKPIIAYEIQDVPPSDWPETLKKPYEGVLNDPAGWARFCQDVLKAKAIALRLIGTHPDGENRSPAEAARCVSDVLSAVEIPLLILGSNHAEKDTYVLTAVAEVAKDSNSVIGKAQESNYKTIVAAAMSYNLKLIAMSELDVNLSKQLNILITQMGFDRERLIIDPMSSALGYGLEYTYSVMERIRLAALTQNDIAMQPPLLGDIGMYVWKTKETQAKDTPQWGSLEERAIAWEAVTAMALLIAGANLLIMRHPKAIEAVEKMIEELL